MYTFLVTIIILFKGYKPVFYSVMQTFSLKIVIWMQIFLYLKMYSFLVAIFILFKGYKIFFSALC